MISMKCFTSIKKLVNDESFLKEERQYKFTLFISCVCLPQSLGHKIAGHLVQKLRNRGEGKAVLVDVFKRHVL